MKSEKDKEDYEYIKSVIIKNLQEQQKKDGISVLGDVNLLNESKSKKSLTSCFKKLKFCQKKNEQKK